MKIKAIKSEEEYQSALKRLKDIFHAPAGTDDGDEAEILSILIEKYEDEHFPIEAHDHVEAIKFRMEQMNLSNKDLVPILG